MVVRGPGSDARQPGRAISRAMGRFRGQSAEPLAGLRPGRRGAVHAQAVRAEIWIRRIARHVVYAFADSAVVCAA